MSRQRGILIQIAVCLMLFSATATFAVQPSTAEGSLLEVGDYAVYTMGSCRGAGTWFYTPFYGFEDADDPADQVSMYAEFCPVTLRWEVVDVTGDIAEIQVQMAGFGNEAYPGVHLEIRNDTYHPNNTDPVYLPILANLHAKHTVHVDLDTMDMTVDGEYAGRWGFHVTPGEVATSRAEIIRNWYGGAGVSLPVRVTNNPHQGQGDMESLRIAYGIDTVIDIFGGGGPLPEGIHRYLVSGWGQRQQTFPVAGRYHDPDTFLLLVSFSWHYDDLLYHLYGMLIIMDNQHFFPGGLRGSFSFMHLIDTNLIEILELDPGEEDDGGLGDDGDGDGGDSEDEGGVQDGGDGGGGPGEAAGFPWAPVSLFASVAILTAVVAYLRLRPRRGSNNR